MARCLSYAALAVVLFVLPDALALKCFVCDSIDNTNCTKTALLQPAICKPDDDVCVKSLTETGVPAKAGGGANALGYTIVSRKCGRSSAVYGKVDHGQCLRTITGDGGVSTFCVCATHNCNRSGYTTRATVLSGIAAAATALALYSW